MNQRLTYSTSTMMMMMMMRIDDVVVGGYDTDNDDDDDDKQTIDSIDIDAICFRVGTQSHGHPRQLREHLL